MKGNFGPRLGVAFCAAVFALLRCASAQALIVGPGGFADLDSAYAAAQSGDLILVRQDTWFSRLDGKGVRILSDGATYRLDALYGTAPAGIVNLPAGESIELRDFNIVPVGNLVGGTGAAFRIENCAGSVVLMSCVIDGVLTSQVDAAPTFLVESCSRVSIYGGFFNGRNAKQSGVCTPRGTDGVRIENSTVGLYGAFFSGGAYASPYSNGCPNAPDGQGVSAQDSVVYCVDSGVSGGSSQGSGLDIMSLDSVFYGPTGGYVLEGGGIYYANGSPSPNVFGVNANVVLGSYRKPWMTATRSAVGATLDVYAQTANSSIGLTVFAVGAHGWVGPGPLPSQDPLTIDPTQPFEAIGATSTSYSWSITPSVMMALRGHSFAASAALLMTSGELRLSTADILAF